MAFPSFESFISSPYTSWVVAIGLAGLALSGKLSMSAAKWLIVAAGALAVVGAYRSEFVLGLPRLPRLLTTLLVASVCGLAIYYLAQWMEPKPLDATDNSNRSSEPLSHKDLTLHELFDADIRTAPNRPIAKQNTHTITLAAFPQEPIAVIARLVIDADAGVEFLGCYLPSSPHTYQVSEILSDEIPKMVEHWKGFGFTQHPKGQRSIDLDTAKFSGRVFLYHESRLTQAEIDKLAVMYREKGFEVVFRGPDYLIAKSEENKKRSALDIKYEPRSPFKTDTVGNSGIRYKTRTVAVTTPIAGKVSLKIPMLSIGNTNHPNVYLRPIADQPDELEAGETGYWHVIQMNTQENQIRLMRKGNEKYPLGSWARFVIEARCKSLVTRKQVTAEIESNDLLRV